MNLSVVIAILRSKAMVVKGGVAQREIYGLHIRLSSVTRKTHYEESWRLSRDTGVLDEDINSVLALVSQSGGVSDPSWNDDGSIEFRYDRPKAKTAGTPAVALPQAKTIPKQEGSEQFSGTRDRDFYPSQGLLDKKLSALASKMGVTPDMMGSGFYDEEEM